MISELPMGRGSVDAMGYERATFSFSQLGSGTWVGHFADSDGRVLVEDGRLASITGSDAMSSEQDQPFLLGRTTDGVVHLLWVVPVGSAIEGLVPLTQVAGHLSSDESLLASRAVALAKWHATFRFCPRCGSQVKPAEAGWASRCVSCGALEYPRMDPVVIMKVTDARERLLLASNATWAERRMSLPAGYVEAGETPPQAVEREIWEEVHLRVENAQYLASQVWPGPRSLMLAFSATVIGGIADPKPDGVEVREARFFSREELIRAFDTGEVRGPGPTSIAYAVIHDWLDSGS